MTGRLIAIGDIHGCRAALEALWQALAVQSQDTVVFLGDYVDRGPDTKGVIDRLVEYRQQCNLVAIYGNHEEMMLNVVREAQPPQRWLQYGGVDTLDSYGFMGDLKVIPESHHQFFDSMVNFYETESHIFTHANYDAQLPMERQDIVHLRWLKLTEHSPEPHMSGKRVVVGHTPHRGGLVVDLGFLICIDTFCYGGGWLTAVDLHSGQTWQANIDGKLNHQR